MPSCWEVAAVACGHASGAGGVNRTPRVSLFFSPVLWFYALRASFVDARCPGGLCILNSVPSALRLRFDVRKYLLCSVIAPFSLVQCRVVVHVSCMATGLCFVAVQPFLIALCAESARILVVWLPALVSAYSSSL